ncbi:MAG: hypothetical protein M1839_004600 [Geoglossum umbratile]|nr:MAG: hypothetical protein M1839_004600 [Geoglossum umbratile]
MAKSMLDKLRNVRDKAALVVVADNRNYGPYQDILQSCCGVVFFGVPNQGIRFEELICTAKGERSEELVHGLLTDEDTEMSDVLSALSMDFGRAQKDFRHGMKAGLGMLCYYETLRSRTSGQRVLERHQNPIAFSPSKVTTDQWSNSGPQLIQDTMPSVARIPRNISRRQQADNAHPGTCDWILQRESLQKWVNGERTLLWIKGKPGAGKSTLMEFIYQALRKMPKRERQVNLDFFFHGRSTALQRIPIGMLRSLLHQLFSKVHSVRGPIRDAFQEKKGFGEAGKDWEWQLKELEDLLFSAVTYIAEIRATTIFVDALDEAGPEAARHLVAYFQRLNDRLANIKRFGRICISCRHYPVVAAIPGLRIVVEREDHEDCWRYARGAATGDK